MLKKHSVLLSLAYSFSSVCSFIQHENLTVFRITKSYGHFFVLSDSAYLHTELCGSRVCPPYSKCQSGDGCVCPKCSHDGKKVCGSDGMTYNDFCKLQKAACQRNTIIKMEKKGPCEGRFLFY